MELKKFREKYNFTQADMSRSLNISLNTYIRWELGIGNPGFENKIKLVKYFGTFGEKWN